MDFPTNKAVIRIQTYNELISLLFPGVEGLEEVSPEGSAGVDEVVFFVDEIALVLAVDRV